ncbi:cap-specific mRNA (nucleoside-2'-O-)-methyltransferase 1-like [Protopterus annectens]|uniref:cap-specific mRNA (nucleoside-2'-O-)-methyltransferase 1-like n=1 Tax=Protopterus annectens TaxID=7888 RepID=UPI001CF96B5E|nr:cap-specific mRNA (nucleoside-2'-O-)-methyltransferase 1-like [Protopterus annectens]
MEVDCEPNEITDMPFEGSDFQDFEGTDVKDMRLEAEAVVNDVIFAVGNMYVSKILPCAEDVAYINVKIKEGNRYCLELTDTGLRDSSGKPLLKERDPELLYFADICAGPGGFSEYVLWRRKWHAKGFGMTLKGQNDFKLEDFYAAPSELFEPYYGEGGIDGDGDIMRPENISAFRNFVLEYTDRKGVHFLMADGGFSVEGQENIQEILSKQLLLCQFLMALSVVRTGGLFVCKTFDLFTPSSVGLVYLLYCCFERISLFKPLTSRLANSERYIICRGLKPGIESDRDYLFSVNIKLNQLKKSKQDVNKVVSMSVMKEDTNFLNSMMSSNEGFCAVQIKALAKIHAFVLNPILSVPTQVEIRKECLKLWGIPDQARVAPSSSDPKSKFFELIQNMDIDAFNYKPTLLTVKNLEKIRQVFDYRCMVSGGEQVFLLSLGLHRQQDPSDGGEADDSIPQPAGPFVGGEADYGIPQPAGSSDGNDSIPQSAGPSNGTEADDSIPQPAGPSDGSEVDDNIPHPAGPSDGGEVDDSIPQPKGPSDGNAADDSISQPAGPSDDNEADDSIPQPAGSSNGSEADDSIPQSAGPSDGTEADDSIPQNNLVRIVVKSCSETHRKVMFHRTQRWWNM